MSEDIYRLDFNVAGSWRRGIEFDAGRISAVERAAAELISAAACTTKARMTCNGTPFAYCQADGVWRPAIWYARFQKVIEG